MKKHLILKFQAAFGLPLLMALAPICQAAQPQDFGPPAVFQAAGLTASSIQSSVDRFRFALDPNNHNNGNNPGPLALASGHREINWDGGNSAIVATTPPVTPFNT